VENTLPEESDRAKALLARAVAHRMESTSGAADLESLRGDSGEAALGMSAGLRKQVGVSSGRVAGLREQIVGCPVGPLASRKRAGRRPRKPKSSFTRAGVRGETEGAA